MLEKWFTPGITKSCNKLHKRWKPTVNLSKIFLSGPLFQKLQIVQHMHCCVCQRYRNWFGNCYQSFLWGNIFSLHSERIHFKFTFTAVRIFNIRLLKLERYLDYYFIAPFKQKIYLTYCQMEPWTIYHCHSLVLRVLQWASR